MDALTWALAVAVVVVALVLRLRRAVLYRRRADRVIARWVAEVREGEALDVRGIPLPRVADRGRWPGEDRFGPGWNMPRQER